MPIDLTFPSFRDHLSPLLLGTRTESEAFLIWFMRNFYRLDDITSVDAVCDGIDDKGIDGIYVDDNLERIDLFQSKISLSTSKTDLGDSPLRDFVGAVSQFSTGASAQAIADTTGNVELKNIIDDEDIPAKIDDGYEVRGIFVTNKASDGNATTYLATQPNIVVYDHDEITDRYLPPSPSIPITKSVSFDVSGMDIAEYRVNGVRTLIAPLNAKELIGLDGLASGALFAWNVRQSLGRSKVNREISRSIEDQEEHKNFLLYHNGLTILASSIRRRGDIISINGYSVVNGCQSLTSFYDSEDNLSNDLRILCKLINLSPDSELASKITHHSNNQNPINARDLQSNSVHQRRLQNAFAERYGDQIFYRVKRGEVTELPLIIDNDDAARNLLAFDMQQPWTCHQTYKLFDDLYTDIFARPEATAERIIVLGKIYECVEATLDNLENKQMAGYRLSKYFLLYLLRSALELDGVGSQLCREPETFLAEPDGLSRIESTISLILSDLVIDLNAELKERADNDNPIDYKRELKSPTAVRSLERSIIPQYKKAIDRDRATSFSQEWEASSPA